MHLSRTAEYALRAMAQLALLEADQTMRAQELSDATAIPPAYVSKVMRRMVIAGLVDAQKGHGGGFKLARSASKIRFADVLEAAGMPIGENDCAFGFARCNSRSPCPLHFAWKDLGERFRSWTLENTLGDVASQKDGLVRLRLHRVGG